MRSVEETPPPDLLTGVDWTTEDGLSGLHTPLWQDWRYCALWGKWLVWTGVRWNRIRCSMCLIWRAVSAGWRHSRRTALGSQASWPAPPRSRPSENRTLRSQARVHRRGVGCRRLGAHTPGGVVDLRTGRMRPHRRDDRMTKVTTATPQGDSPTWRAFLADVCRRRRRTDCLSATDGITA